MKTELKIVSNALQFLQRVDIKGSEAEAMIEVKNYLGVIGNDLNDKIEKESKE